MAEEKTFKMYRVFEDEEEIIIARLGKEIEKQSRSISKQEILQIIIQESNIKK